MGKAKHAAAVQPLAGTTVQGTYADDQIFGFAAFTAHGSWGSDTIIGSSDNDKLYGDQNNDTLSGGDGNDLINGGSGDDTLMGGAGTDKEIGGSGNDTISFLSVDEAKGDTVDGGTGVDMLNFFFADDKSGVTFAANDPALTQSFNGWFNFTGIEQYTISAGSGNDTLTGYLLSDTLLGGDGNDTLKGRDGDDVLSGDGGTDKLSGDSGNDFLTGGDGTDTLHGGSGTDVLASDSYGSDADTKSVDKLYGEGGSDYISIGVGDTADGGANTGGKGDAADVNYAYLDFTKSKVGESFTFSDAAIHFESGGSIVHFQDLEFHGGNAKDVVTGGDSYDALYGGGGADVLHGGKGFDDLNGQAGDDTVHGDDGDDTITDDGGTFNISYDDMGQQVVTLTHLTGKDHYYGDTGDDTLAINGYDGEAKSFDGGKDYDTVDFSGANQNDHHMSAYVDMTAQAKNDGLAQGYTFTGIEQIIGSDQDDTMIADNSGMSLMGGDGGDVLTGGDGGDVLTGGAGSDVMTGGHGKDVFDLSESMSDSDDDGGDDNGGFDVGGHNHWQADEIKDFTHADSSSKGKADGDHIQLHLADFGLAKASDFHFVNGTSAKSDDPTFLFDSKTHELLFDADGNGSDHAAVLIATLDKVTSLAASDFVFG